MIVWKKDLVEVKLIAPSVAESWQQLCADRSGFQRRFVELVLGSPQIKGRVLDIGCRGGLPRCLSGLREHFGSLDGVDPDASIASNPLLTCRWQSTLEGSGAPSAAYDLAFAYNVLEHVATPRRFFEEVNRVLKPGGIFWGLTPNGYHPFTVLSRSIEILGLKGFARAKVGANERGIMKVNEYPAYYRCNTPRAVMRATRGLPFRSAHFYFYPCLQWDTYFPRILRGLPRLYDWVAGVRVKSLMQILMVRLERE